MINRDLLTLDGVYDREFASDGLSRYGAYLPHRAHLFLDGDAPPDPVWFTVLAWRVSNSPVMSPGYVQRRPNISAGKCRHVEGRGVLVADVEAPMRWPARLHPIGPARWRSRTLEHDWSDRSPRYVESADDQRALLLIAHMCVPIPSASLPALRHSNPGEVDVADAKRAAAVVCRCVNEAAGPVITAVRESCRGGRW